MQSSFAKFSARRAVCERSSLEHRLAACAPSRLSACWSSCRPGKQAKCLFATQAECPCSFAGVAELADALDSRSTVMLGRYSAVAVSLPFSTHLVLLLKVAQESLLIAERAMTAASMSPKN